MREGKKKREPVGRGRGCMDLTGCGTYRHPDCAVVIFRGKDKRKNFLEERPLIPESVTGPPTSPPLVGAVKTIDGEGKAAEQPTQVRGFLLQQRESHKTPFHF